jgi:hypothetical protein
MSARRDLITRFPVTRGRAPDGEELADGDVLPGAGDGLLVGLADGAGLLDGDG